MHNILAVQRDENLESRPSAALISISFQFENLRIYLSQRIAIICVTLSHAHAQTGGGAGVGLAAHMRAESEGCVELKCLAGNPIELRPVPCAR